jgi:hypothetical protein
MVGVVPLPGGMALLVQRRVEVFLGTVLASACRDEPISNFRVGVVRVHSASPAADLDLEQNHIIDGADPLVRCAHVGELLRRLLQQWMGDMVQRNLG